MKHSKQMQFLLCRHLGCHRWKEARGAARGAARTEGGSGGGGLPPCSVSRAGAPPFPAPAGPLLSLLQPAEARPPALLPFRAGARRAALLDGSGESRSTLVSPGAPHPPPLHYWPLTFPPVTSPPSPWKRRVLNSAGASELSGTSGKFLSGGGGAFLWRGGPKLCRDGGEVMRRRCVVL